jgi:glycosyltransferase involved in cell wall biosynthesis
MKINVLIGCLNYQNLTGSELYVYELAKQLKKLNCSVSIVSFFVGGMMKEMSNHHGIKVYDFTSLPTNEKFDIIHCQHKPVTTELIKIFPSVKKICTIHSEVYGDENPIIDWSIYKYIAIRPEIKTHLIKNYNIKEKNIEIIYNPIDESKFNKKNIKDLGYTLFVGTIDNLRKNTIFDLVEYTKKENKEFYLVGKIFAPYINELIHIPHLRYFDATPEIETFVKNCHETAGVLLGRTTIEGWLCDKPGWIYNIDSNGNIIEKNRFSPPEDLEKFFSANVALKIKNEYEKIINI